MKMFKNVLLLLMIIIPAVIVYFITKPTENPKIKLLEQRCDSLQIVITKNNITIDSIQNETKKLHEKSENLKSELTNINKKAKDLKKQHEKDIAHINSLSNNDIARLFTDEFSKIE